LFQTQLTAVEATAERRRGTDTGAGSAMPQKFEICSTANCWMRQEKSTYLIIALQGRATDVLDGVPKGATYQETLEALEDCFRDQHFAAAYHS
jgi:hypothetical protein